MTNAPAAGCLTYAFATSLGLHPPDLRRLRNRLDRVGVEPAAAVARAAHHEDGGLVEHPVERAEQGLVPREELVPGAWRHVARGDHGVGALLLVAAVDHVEEEVGARPVENASPNLVHDQAGRLYQLRQRPRVAAPCPREVEPVEGTAPLVGSPEGSGSVSVDARLPFSAR